MRNLIRKTTSCHWISFILMASWVIIFSLVSCTPMDTQLLATELAVRKETFPESGEEADLTLTEKIEKRPDDDVFGYTYHRPDGNRLVEGKGDLPNISPLDIQLKTTPIWLVSVPYQRGSVWAVKLQSGDVEAFYVDHEGVKTFMLETHFEDIQMPIVLRLREDELTLLGTTDADQSPFSHPVAPTTPDYGLAYLRINGDFILQTRMDEERETLDLDVLVDGRIIQKMDNSPDSRMLLLTNPTDRYTHGVLGDQIEAGGFTIVDLTDLSASYSSYVLQPPAVFEGIAPIWTDLDGDGASEIIITQSDSVDGARIVIYSEGGQKLAAGPGIGQGYRWRHQLAVAPFGPDEELELAVIRTPHIGGVLEFYRMVAGELQIVAELPGFSSHTINSRNLDTALAGDFDGDGRYELLVPNQEHSILMAVQRTDQGVEIDWSLPLDGSYATNLAAVSLEGARIALGVGTDQGILRIWFPDWMDD